MAETVATPQPTPSPLCNYLIELARRVHEGRSAPEELKQFAQERLAELPKVREETLGRIHAEGEAHARLHAESIAALADSFTDMEGALREAIRFAETRQEQVYRSAVQRLREAGFSSEAASNAYQRSELSHGPTEMPVLNLLYKLKDGHFGDGSVPREDLEIGIQGAVKMARSAAEEVRGSEPQDDAKEGLARAYDHFADVLEAVERAVPGGNQAVTEALEAAAEAGKEVRAAMEAYTAHATTQGPTRMAHANFILNLAEAQNSGAVPAEGLARGLEVFRKSLEDLQAQIEAMASIPSDSDKVAQQMGPTREAFAAHHEALDMFERYLAGEPAAYEPARQALIDAAEALADCKEAFDQIGEMEGKVPCVRCGAPNDPSNRQCSNCGAQLLVAAGMGSTRSTMSFQEEGGQAQVSGELVMTENLVRLFETVNGVAEGRLGVHQFEEVLDWFEGLVRDGLLGLPAAPELSREGLDEQQQEQLAKAEEQIATAREEIEVGAQELLGSLDELRQYAGDSDSRHLVEGVKMVRDASIKVQRAQRQIDELVEASKASR